MNLIISRGEAAEKLRKQISKGREIRDYHVESREELEKLLPRKVRWSDYSQELLSRLFDDDAEKRKYPRFDLPSSYGLPFERSHEHFKRSVDSELNHLESLLERLELIPERAPGYLTQPTLSGSLVFVVHGHDESAKHSVARFIERIGLKPIILHEQPNAGKTIIEKIENHGEAAFVVVVLTPDDVGYSKTEPQQQFSRARQNVIFELGYFTGKLGRSRVCALYKEPVEIPSDFHGVLFVPLDPNDGWQTRLAKEFKHAGLQFDVTKIL